MPCRPHRPHRPGACSLHPGKAARLAFLPSRATLPPCTIYASSMPTAGLCTSTHPPLKSSSKAQLAGGTADGTAAAPPPPPRGGQALHICATRPSFSASRGCSLTRPQLACATAGWSEHLGGERVLDGSLASLPARIHSDPSHGDTSETRDYCRASRVRGACISETSCACASSFSGALETRCRLLYLHSWLSRGARQPPASHSRRQLPVATTPWTACRG